MSENARAQIRALIDGADLSAAATAATIEAMLEGTLTASVAAAWLTALAAKGESVSEVVGAVQALRLRALTVHHQQPRVLDVCGTGGDGHDTINISTAVAFIVAACGVAVAKHGNRSASSRCGSADVLEYLGVDLAATPAAASDALARGEVVFLFAQAYHPALQSIGPLRRELGIRTIFNLIGPLLNPANATHQLIGVADPRKLDVMAGAAVELGLRGCAILHAENGLDEIAGDAPTALLRVDMHGMHLTQIQPEHFGITASLDALRGGDVASNAAALVAILEGEQSPRADVVALNAAVALVIAEAQPTIAAGLQRARQALGDGSARAALARIQSLGRNA